ncbi:translation elongation factor 4 [Rhodopirellula europaea]|jgi:GTP-binding protein LepA|uniref:Elongation factor 4 n=2 Tax=Rhodopirellula europaea TaxID=1263866 RepID=M2AND9_9BACT|nr:translation elongation factor 4 [Rhodopirellula europaea]EMB18640.1 GTP-binding protein LepA [Rhodopirellula europaea 6C]EMI25813.1 GTP-binding protein lepA [Rhodopirellula europaea SH398]MCR9209354.1 translation elongation factor 4 [bacterium]|tara:strand:- start:132 stop:1928 length:1797 start_codon:yes stop_codon:yes gene_type:complete
MKHIRNFCIIAHIDHGKSTLADRLIQSCGGVTQREFHDQMLDSMDIERERGITIKSNTVTLNYTAKDGEAYQLNLIDTPGHVDFSHEVRRSLMACEGALMVVDASQGVEAQTVANLYLALEYDLELLPVINKIDLPAADVDRVRGEIDEDLGLDPFVAIPVSAKTGQGIEDVLEGIVTNLPAPQGDPKAPLKALVFDAFFDKYRGVILQCRVMEGTLKPKDDIHFMHADRDFTVDELGYNQFKLVPKKELTAGEVGYIVAGVKTVQDIEIGDTITLADRPANEPIPGYQPARQVVFSSVYPMSTDEYQDLTKALEKLSINDAALTFEKDSSAALGFGYRCGFLGLLHLDVVQERLQREFDIGLVISAPSVQYKIKLKDGTTQDVDNPTYWPDPSTIDSVSEPYIKAQILIPEEYVGPVMELCREHRSESQTMNYLSAGRLEVTSEMPLGEVLFDFYGKLKMITRGYGSFDYVPIEYRKTDIVKVDILVNKEPVDALAYLVHRDKSRARAMHYCEQLAEAIPRHQFKIPIQGAIGGTVIARTTIAPYRKDVTAKLYGGDVSRKKKLLEKQKKGKAKMKQFGSVNIPQKAFISVLRTDKD